jgi:hypothetical protein
MNITKSKDHFIFKGLLYIIAICLMQVTILNTENNAAPPLERLKKQHKEISPMQIPPLNSDLRVGINVLSNGTEGFGGIGLHSSKYDIIFYANNYSDDNQTTYKENYSKILLEGHLKTPIGIKSWFTYGIGFEKTIGKMIPEITQDSSTFPIPSSKIDSSNKMFLCIGFESQIAKKLLLNVRYEVMSSKSVELENNISYSFTEIGKTVQLSMIFLI